MSERLLEELTRWLVKYKGRCKCCGKYDAENLLEIKILEFSNIPNVWFGKTQFLPKSIYSIEKLYLNCFICTNSAKRVDCGFEQDSNRLWFHKHAAAINA